MQNDVIRFSEVLGRWQQSARRVRSCLFGGPAKVSLSRCEACRVRLFGMVKSMFWYNGNVLKWASWWCLWLCLVRCVTCSAQRRRIRTAFQLNFLGPESYSQTSRRHARKECVSLRPSRSLLENNPKLTRIWGAQAGRGLCR